MKKYLLSGFVIISFIAYAIYDKKSSIQLVNSSPEPIRTSNSPIPTPIQTASLLATPTATTPPTQKPSGQYKDGEYIGNPADAFYGNIQVKAVIQNGKLVDIVFLQYPNDRQTSVMINTQAMPYLKSEAIAAQSAKVNIVTGATDTSQAFRESLDNALLSARTSI